MRIAILATLFATIPATGQDQQFAADEAIRSMLTEASQGNLGAAWNMLPASYRNRVGKLLGALADKVDDETYGACRAVVAEAANVLGRKKKLILSMPQVAMYGMLLGDAEAVPAIYDTVVVVLDTIGTSQQLAERAKLATADLGKLMTNIGGKLTKNTALMKSFPNPEDAKIEVVDKGEDSTVLKVTTPDEDPQRIVLERVEGKWVPKEIVDGFAQIGEVEKQVAELPKVEGPMKEMTMATVQQAKMILGQLDKAENAADIGKLMQMFGGR